jgi:hypothetical protein
MTSRGINSRIFEPAWASCGLDREFYGRLRVAGALCAVLMLAVAGRAEAVAFTAIDLNPAGF